MISKCKTCKAPIKYVHRFQRWLLDEPLRLMKVDSIEAAQIKVDSEFYILEKRSARPYDNLHKHQPVN